MRQRLISLDVLRGLTVMLMIMVNNGVGHDQYPQLMHSAWNGITLCDLVFPFFLFMVGVSIAFSRPQKEKILVRTLKMFLLGVLLHAWDMWIGGSTDILSHLRVWGVLQRIALCYMMASFIALWVKERYVWPIIVVLTLAYTALLHFGHGYAQDNSNLACIIDQWLVGTEHLYQKNAIDPEGLMGTLSALAHTLIGLTVGRVICMQSGLNTRLVVIGILAIALIAIGIMMTPYLPLNKRIWSPSYVFLTCGLAGMLLTLLTVVTDVLILRRWTLPLQWFGMNAIALYVASEMLAPVVRRYGITMFIYDHYRMIGFSAPLASLCYALTFVLIMALLAYTLYRNKCFIKL